MPKIPRQRGAGQRGGAGGQLSNRGSSYSRGGRPSASRGGGGGGKKGGCAVVALASLGGSLALVVVAVTAVAQIL